MDNKYIITKKQADILYITLKFIHDTFVKNKIKYFMVGGTLLGSIRNSGIIPHDDDGDLCIFQEDVPKLRKLISYFNKNGYELYEGIENDDDKPSPCTKRKNSCTWFISCSGKDCLGVDIFVMYSKGNKITYYDPYWETAENGGKKCYFEKDLMFPLIPYRFGNYFLYGPHNAIEHLNRCYGTDWVDKGRVLYDHRIGKFINSKPRKLSVNEFLTFKAPLSTCDGNVPKIICNSKVYKYFSKSKSPSSSTTRSKSKSSIKKK
jgi:phosphorylcholine metabolism protein LicD